MMKSNENNGAVTKSFAKKMESISPFELKNKLIEMADESIKKIAHTMLNAGRGNPNWIATTPREAFFLLGKFGLEECRRVMYLPEGIAGIPQKDGIAARFETFLKTNHSQPGAELLKGTYQYMLLEHAAEEHAGLVRHEVHQQLHDEQPARHGGEVAAHPLRSEEVEEEDQDEHRGERHLGAHVEEDVCVIHSRINSSGG